MKGLIQIQIGQCGNQIGYNYWNKLIDEHKIDINGCYVGNPDDQDLFLGNSELIFDENIFNGKYVPRAILIDTESSVLERIKRSRLNRLFNHDNIIYDNQCTGGVWAAGHYGQSSKFLKIIKNAIRKQSETCYPIAFHLINSLGGGTGSGLGSYLIEYLRDRYPKVLINTFNVIPSPVQNGSVLDYYNTTLSMSSLMNYANGCYFYDNEALRLTCQNFLAKWSGRMNHSNELISRTILGLSACERFQKNLLPTGLKDISDSLQYSNRLHFYIPNVTLTDCKSMNQVFKDLNKNGLNCLLSFQNNKTSKLLSFVSILRGNVNSDPVESNKPANNNDVNKHEFSTSDNSNDTVSVNGKIGICEIPEIGRHISAATFSNSDSMKQIFSRVQENTFKMYSKRAFVHSYVSEKMEEAELSEAFENLIQLKNEYELNKNVPKKDQAASNETKKSNSKTKDKNTTKKSTKSKTCTIN